ncbi:MAG: bifunctional dihydropteridine reductase/dihydrofolate reductase TmpR [Deinococcales bacterium]
MKTALVTGAARGIGQAIALRLGREGYSVAVHYHTSQQEAQATCVQLEALGVKAMALQADVRNPQAASGLVQQAAEGLGGLGVLVNNVGNYIKKPFAELLIEDWQEMLASNLNNTFYTCHAALPIMRQQKYGRIVNLGFAGAQNLIARTNILPYAIAKTGVILLTKAIAQAEATNGITANVVAPGVIENSVSQPLHLIPMGRLGTLEELSEAVWYFVRSDSSYLTGQILEVAGGFAL